MARYIDAELIEPFIHRDEWGTPDETWRPESEFGNLIDKIPTADVKPVVRGKWRTTNLPNGEKLGYCNQCGWTIHLHDNRIYDYCPNCGAEMIKC